MRFPGKGRLNKKLSKYFGGQRKLAFLKFIYSGSFKAVINKQLSTAKQMDIELVTFTNSANFADITLSVLSLIATTGVPDKWTIYADDEFTPEQKNALNLFDFLSLEDWHVNLMASDKEQYSGKWQWRKFLSYSTHRIEKTTIFLDSDVVFYKQFDKYKDYLKKDNWYLPEPTDAYSIVPNVTKNIFFRPDMYLINSGFIVLNQTPPWQIGASFLKKEFTDNSISHFSEQSAINLVYLNDIHAKILEPRVFHVSTIDHFEMGVLNTKDLAIRHYVGPIRFKMWQAGWKQFI